MARQFAARRRVRRWTSIPAVGPQVLTGAGTTIVSGRVDFTTPETVVRCMSEYLMVMDDNAIAADDEATMVVGLGVVSTDAAVAGAGSVPDPAGEPEYPWLYWASHSFFAVAAAVDASLGSQCVRQRVDVKSQRIIRPGHSLLWIVQYVALSGNPEMAASWAHTRVLILES